MMVSTDYVVDFRRAVTLEDLATHIGAPLIVLQEVIEASDQAVFYRKHLIPKRKHGGVRVVWEARHEDLADAHRALARRLDIFARDIDIGYPHPASTAYVRGASTFKNASVHSGARLLLRADISDFFETISSPVIERLFAHRLGLRPAIANALARFTTLNGVLALGLHASPLLANLICHGLDNRLLDLAKRHGCTYSRYADDMAFSSAMALPTRFEVASALAAEGFRLSESKFRKTVRGQAHYVTGLSISESVPHAPRALKRRLRQELYYSTKFGIAEHLERVRAPDLQTGVNRIDGTIRYLNAIEPALAAQARQAWRQALVRDGLRPAYTPRGERTVRRVDILIDETEIAAPDGTILAVACVATDDVARLADVAEEILTKHVADPFSSGKKSMLDKRGMHAADAPEDLQTDFIRLLPALSFRAYLAYESLISDASYSDTYLRLLRALLPRRMKALDRCELTLTIENNPRVRLSDVKALVNEIFDDLVAANDRRPAAPPTVREGRKRADHGLAVADFVLAVFRAYALLESQDNDPRKEMVRKRFERLRDKIRLLIRLSPPETFSRRKPFAPWGPVEQKVHLLSALKEGDSGPTSR